MLLSCNSALVCLSLATLKQNEKFRITSFQETTRGAIVLLPPDKFLRHEADMATNVRNNFVNRKANCSRVKWGADTQTL